MGSTCVLSALDGPHVGPMNLAIRGVHSSLQFTCMLKHSELFMQTAHENFLSEYKNKKTPGFNIDIWDYVRRSLEIYEPSDANYVNLQATVDDDHKTLADHDLWGRDYPLFILWKINTLPVNLSRRKINIYLHFMSLLHIDMTQVLKNPSSSKTRTCWFYKVNIIAADVLAT